MAEVEMLQNGLYADHPALEDILVSPVRLLARLTHVIDNNKGAVFLKLLPAEDFLSHEVRSLAKRPTPLFFTYFKKD